jgi:hypothetical protein
MSQVVRLVPRLPGSMATPARNSVTFTSSSPRLTSMHGRIAKARSPGYRFMQDLPLRHFILSCCRGVTAPVIVPYMVLDGGH